MGVCKSGIYMWLMWHHLGNYLFFIFYLFLQMMEIYFSDLLYYVITIKLFFFHQNVHKETKNLDAAYYFTNTFTCKRVYCYTCSKSTISICDLILFECHHLSRVVRKQAFCICENKDADQLRGNREADQRLCFRYTVSTIPLL